MSKYSVILIDDETVILQGLKKLIDWDSLDISIVGEAQNGAEGLKLIEELTPDIAVSDIAMPGLTGIDMLREIHERNLHVKTIFLSGYQEFSYAREAVRYGAVDYLLKPVSPQDLRQVILRTLEQLRAEDSVHILKKNDSRPELLFQNILRENGCRSRLGDFLSSLGAWETSPGAACAALRIVMKNIREKEENKNLTCFSIYEFIRQYLEETKAGIMIKRDSSTCYLLLPSDHDRELLHRHCRSLRARIQKRYDADIIIGIGCWTDREGQLSYQYQTARFALELYYFEKKAFIDYEEISQDYTHSLEEYQALIRNIRQDMIMGLHPQEHVAQILSAVKLAGNIHYGNKNAVISCCIQLTGEIFATLQECDLTGEGAAEEQAQFLEDLQKKPTFQLLLSCFEDYYRRVFLKIQLLARHRSSSEIVRIKEYIREHFKENITLEEIAGYIGMNPAYLSVFFKKETGQNFKTYLTQIRMTEAIRLLNQTDMKSYQLAEAVGYRDAKQFREKFKELYGVSPQQYKKGMES